MASAPAPNWRWNENLSISESPQVKTMSKTVQTLEADLWHQELFEI